MNKHKQTVITMLVITCMMIFSIDANAIVNPSSEGNGTVTASVEQALKILVIPSCPVPDDPGIQIGQGDTKTFGDTEFGIYYEIQGGANMPIMMTTNGNGVVDPADPGNGVQLTASWRYFPNGYPGTYTLIPTAGLQGGLNSYGKAIVYCYIQQIAILPGCPTGLRHIDLKLYASYYY